MRNGDRQTEFPAHSWNGSESTRGGRRCRRPANQWVAVCAALVLCAWTASSSSAQTLTTLHSFDFADGTNPAAPLIQGYDGRLYGTTSMGGEHNAGTVFKITTSGTLATVHNFGVGFTDGQDPYAGVVQATSGNFYGTTAGAGANGWGTVYEVIPSGAETVLYSFCSQTGCIDGGSPNAGLIESSDENLYGTTVLGGAYNNGTVFKITPGGSLSTVYSFCAAADCSDGSEPFCALFEAEDDNFYGTTERGGANAYGTVFKLTRSGELTTLYSFCSLSNCADGANPYGTLVQGKDGYLYGTTANGGAKGDGTVFRISASAGLKTLHSFCAQRDCADGASPFAGLVVGSDGNLYGTTDYGGANGEGTLYEITPGGVLTTLYAFCSKAFCADGEHPEAPLVQDTSGVFYGTTYIGGTGTACEVGCGTVFSFSAGLRPFVETLPASGKAGSAVKILGTNLTGATAVTFNGTAATFKVVSPSLITTTVPAGATTGTVRVKLPGGTLSSNVPFRVLP